MADVVIAPSEADARAVEAVERHHAELSGALAVRVDGVLAALARSDARESERERERLAEWCSRDLLPHARAEENTLYATARRSVAGRLLVDGMLADHAVIERLVRGLTGDAADPVRAAASAAALREVFEAHLAKENELVLPLLLATPGVSVAGLVDGMHELLGGGPPEAGEHECSCGEADPPGRPELDVRTIPHAIRHATVLGALETVRPGDGLVLVAPHDPVPLLAEIGERWPDRFTVDYLERGPRTWRLTLARLGR